jgi:hypothetical protein
MLVTVLQILYIDYSSLMHEVRLYRSETVCKKKSHIRSSVRLINYQFQLNLSTL